MSFIDNLKSAFYAQYERVKGPEPIKNSELVFRTETHALGDGLWSIEVLDYNGCCIKEFVGSNGQCYDEEADDLWSKLQDWSLEVAYYTPSVYKTPAGAEVSFKDFVRCVEQGRLLGVILSF